MVPLFDAMIPVELVSNPFSHAGGASVMFVRPPPFPTDRPGRIPGNLFTGGYIGRVGCAVALSVPSKLSSSSFLIRLLCFTKFSGLHHSSRTQHEHNQ